jgi:AcrR family transcriptional regulator
MTVIDAPRPGLRRARGDRTRRTILEQGAQLASLEGLEGLSIGRLAAHLGMSKSGLYAHFRSKEELQLAAIRTAADMYEAALVVPALEEPPGRARLLGFVDRYLDYVRDGPFPGGCFFIAAAVDPVRLRARVKALLAEEQRKLLDFLESCVRDGQLRGELPPAVDAVRLAFSVDALLTGADLNFVLFDDPEYLELARAEVRRLPDLAPAA